MCVFQDSWIQACRTISGKWQIYAFYLESHPTPVLFKTNANLFDFLRYVDSGNAVNFFHGFVEHWAVCIGKDTSGDLLLAHRHPAVTLDEENSQCRFCTIPRIPTKFDYSKLSNYVGVVSIDKLHDLVQESSIQTITVYKCPKGVNPWYCRAAAIHKAMEKVNDRGYNAVYRNCENFAFECCSGLFNGASTMGWQVENHIMAALDLCVALSAILLTIWFKGGFVSCIVSGALAYLLTHSLIRKGDGLLVEWQFRTQLQMINQNRENDRLFVERWNSQKVDFDFDLLSKMLDTTKKRVHHLAQQINILRLTVPLDFDFDDEFARCLNRYLEIKSHWLLAIEAEFTGKDHVTDEGVQKFRDALDMAILDLKLTALVTQENPALYDREIKDTAIILTLMIASNCRSLSMHHSYLTPEQIGGNMAFSRKVCNDLESLRLNLDQENFTIQLKRIYALFADFYLYCSPSHENSEHVLAVKRGLKENFVAAKSLMPDDVVHRLLDAYAASISLEDWYESSRRDKLQNVP